MGAEAGSGPHTEPCGSVGGFGAAVSREAWQRPGAREEGERAVVPVRLPAQGCSNAAKAQRAPPACSTASASRAPRQSESSGLQAAAAGQERHADRPRARSGPGASRESQGISHGARARGNAADTGWQCHGEPTVTVPRLTVAAPR